MSCLIHRGESLPCHLCALESRLPDLQDWPSDAGRWRLEAQARYLERLTEQVAMTGQIQGETLHIAHLLRELAKKLAA